MLIRPANCGRHFQKGIAIMTGISARRDLRRLPHGSAPQGPDCVLQKDCKTNPITSEFLNGLAFEGLRTLAYESLPGSRQEGGHREYAKPRSCSIVARRPAAGGRLRWPPADCGGPAETCAVTRERLATAQPGTRRPRRRARCSRRPRRVASAGMTVRPRNRAATDPASGL
jgi:hypothetical protein